MGADDYITKPFNILEVKARIKAIMRRNAKKKKKRVTEQRKSSPGGGLKAGYGQQTRLYCRKRD